MGVDVFDALDISIHALRKESDCSKPWVIVRLILFQSTLSVRRATGMPVFSAAIRVFQSTLSVRRATSTIASTLNSSIFQSTLSVRRATFIFRHMI